MDKPIYGDEHSKIFKILFWMFTGFVAFSVLLSLIALIIYTFLESGHWQHSLFAAFLIVLLVPLGILIYWQRYTYVDPKFKIVIVILALTIVFGCAVSLTYVWGLRFPGDSCYIFDPDAEPQNPRLIKLDDYYYRPKTKKCFYAANSDACMGVAGSCAVFGKRSWSCGRWNQTRGVCLGASLPT